MTVNESKKIIFHIAGIIFFALVVVSAAFYGGMPNWRATLNGTEIPIEKADGRLISFPLPKNESTVKLEFRESFSSERQPVSHCAFG